MIDRDRLAGYLAEYAAGTVQEWMRLIDVDEDALGPGTGAMQLRAGWHEDGVFTVGTSPYSDDHGRFRLAVSVHPLGPGNDPAQINAMHERAGAPEWIASTFLHIVTGDRVRIGQEEAEVTQGVVQLWHAQDGGWIPTGEKKPDGTDKVTKQVIADDHWEVRAALRLATGRELPLTLFPPETAVEILCTPARKAQLALSHAGFIGTTELT